jgi:hypothetical protein
MFELISFTFFGLSVYPQETRHAQSDLVDIVDTMLFLSENSKVYILHS